MPPTFDFWNGTGDWLETGAFWSLLDPPTGGTAEIETGTVFVTTPVSAEGLLLLKVDSTGTMLIAGPGGEFNTKFIANSGSINISGGELTADNIVNPGSISISDGQLTI